MSGKDFSLDLTNDESVVLNEFLQRILMDKSVDHSNLFESKAEFWVLNTLCCNLEKKLVAPFQDNYKDILENARRNVLTEYGES
jgi:hypothetical protein